MDVIPFGSFSHVIIMKLKVDPYKLKVDPYTVGGARILIKENSIKAIDACQCLKKAQLIIANFTNAFLKQLFHMLFVLTV